MEVAGYPPRFGAVIVEMRQVPAARLATAFHLVVNFDQRKRYITQAPVKGFNDKCGNEVKIST
jgi:hypothetical protein